MRCSSNTNMVLSYWWMKTNQSELPYVDKHRNHHIFLCPILIFRPSMWWYYSLTKQFLQSVLGYSSWINANLTVHHTYSPTKIWWHLKFPQKRAFWRFQITEPASDFSKKNTVKLIETREQPYTAYQSIKAFEQSSPVQLFKVYFYRCPRKSYDWQPINCFKCPWSSSPLIISVFWLKAIGLWLRVARPNELLNGPGWVDDPNKPSRIAGI